MNKKPFAKTGLITKAALAATLLIPGSYASAGLSKSDCQDIVAAAAAEAAITVSGLRVGGAPTKMHIVCANRDGKILAFHSDPDAWGGSASIAMAKANTARAFSSDENALSSRSIGCLSQPGGPLWQIGNSNQSPSVKGDANIKLSKTVSGLIQFPGGFPLYKDSALAGAIGVSGDGVDQDEAVAKAGTEANAGIYLPPAPLLAAAPYYELGSGECPIVLPPPVP